MKPNVLPSCLFLVILILCLSVSPVFSAPVQLQNGSISGAVRDQQNNALSGAKVSVFDSKDKLFVTVVTNKDDGSFLIDNLAAGNYRLVIEHDGFKPFNNDFLLNETDTPNKLEITLTAADISEGLSITAVVDTAQESFEASQQTEYATKSSLKIRPGLLLPQLLQEEKGIRLVQGSAFYGQIIVRGLTGQRVAALIDGIRFNNSTFASGLEPTFGLIDSNTTSRVELIYGPGSAIYGSDALGGTINVISERAKFPQKGFEVHGAINPFFSSADVAGGGDFKISAGNRKISILVSGFGRRINDLRAGQGIDSHSIVTTNLGLSSKFFGDRLQDTGYLHYGGTGKLVYKINDEQQLSFSYQHVKQENTRLYWLLNGGVGFRSAPFSPQVLDFLYTRYEKRNLNFLDSLTATFSYNRQQQQFNVNVAAGAPTLDEVRRSTALGYSLQATTHIGSRQFLTFGGEIYDDNADNKRLLIISQNTPNIPLAGTFPNGAKNLSYGAYIQDTVEVVPNKIRINGGVRYSAFFFKATSKDNPLDAFGRPTVPNLSFRNDDVTYNLETVFFIKERLSLAANITRGFRSPNIVDLGSSGSFPTGFQVLNSEAVSFGSFVGTTADANAVSNGKKLSLLKPESLLNYELSAKYLGKYITGNVTFFRGTINDFLTDRALILPPGAVGKTIGGLPIVGQSPTGTIFVPTDLRPVIVKTNGANIRLYGIEASGQIRITSAFLLSGNFSYLRGKDLNPPPLTAPAPGDMAVKRANDIPDIEGGLPPATGFLSLRYQSQKGKFWVEGYSNMASYQDRLSSLDLADIRIAATRTRGGIGFFFNNGAVARGLVGKGPNGQPILLATGETVQQVQDRILGPGITRAPLFAATPGYATFNLRGGFQLGERSNLIIIFENILDKNYRLHGSGIDAPGRNLVVRYSWIF